MTADKIDIIVRRLARYDELLYSINPLPGMSPHETIIKILKGSKQWRGKSGR